MNGAQQTAMDLLLSRQSRWPLVEPAPSKDDLDRVIDLALRAPDHGQLQPWRFVLIRGEARQALGEVFVQAAKARDPQGDAERLRGKAMAAPLLIAWARTCAPATRCRRASRCWRWEPPQ